TEMFSYLSKNFIEILKNNYLWNYCILIVNKTKDYIHIFPAFITSVIFFVSITSFAQNQKVLIFPTDKTVRPLEELPIICKESGMLSVKDSKGRVYIKCQALTVNLITVGGACGLHTVNLIDNTGKVIDSSSFVVEAKTNINDGGTAGELFSLLYNGMYNDVDNDENQITHDGKTYHFFVPWVLDNNNTDRGMQYFSSYANEMVDLFKLYQEPNGMIWSFVSDNPDNWYYYKTAYSSIHYFKKLDDIWFVRQPVENHVEYNFVNLIYRHWKASGDNKWMKENLECAAKALDYCFTDTLRWSKRFHLLKRPYCIDSWDFQVNDEYTPQAPISPTMVIVSGKTKFGIFFGDNTGYFQACNQLAEMFDYDGQIEKSLKYKQRGEEILASLSDLSWNGKYFTHFIDEDSTVKRNLGVDEKSQISQGNMYSLNRGLPHAMNVAIINTYLDLRKKLPPGSIGEWYSIYPPFEKGFENHSEKWQYMNGGIAGHAIGELARGAYENGFEDYGSDIMKRLLNIGKQYGNKVFFSYTGSIPPPPPAPNFRTFDLSEYANMDLWDIGGKNVFTWMGIEKQSGNDMRGLPVGEQVFKNIRFRIVDPGKNRRRAVIAVSTEAGFPRQKEVIINDTASAVYLLHSSSDNIPVNVAGAITFLYSDGTEASQYLFKEKDVTNWWFSNLNNERAGVAWWGSNLLSPKVGVCWTVIDNPYPLKKISKLNFSAPLEGGIYVIIGISLADRKLYIKPKVESYGGPDNWAAANGMAALIEGLAGVKNTGLAFENVTLSPRWSSFGTDSADVTVHFPASNGYVAYRYVHNFMKRQIKFIFTGSGNNANVHILLPKGVREVQSLILNSVSIPFNITKVENSMYIDFIADLYNVQTAMIYYINDE
ncbi:MAG: hypothetical protein ABR980_02400, partial [Ignavibacteriaceae bacterium]